MGSGAIFLSRCRLLRSAKVSVGAVCLGFLLLAIPVPAQDANDPNPPEPEIVSVFPQASRRSTRWQATISGRNLEGARAVWFSKPGLKGEVLKLEEVKPPEGEKPKAVKEYRVTVQMETEPTAGTGIHFMRLISSLGLSNAVQLRVHDLPVVTETVEAHESPRTAQAIRFPVVVNGRIEKPGETDHYAFDVAKDQEPVFDVIASREAAATAFHPQMALYRLASSWFNPARAERIAFTDQLRGESVIINTDPRDRTGTWVTLRHRFTGAGRYYLEVGSLYGKGGPENIYQLRVAEAEKAPPISFWEQHPWKERNFARPVGAAHVDLVRARTVPQTVPSAPATAATSGNAPVAAKAADLPSAATGLEARLAASVEQEPNDSEAQAPRVSIPAVLEGAIDHEGDIDAFRFMVSQGQKLAFEIETPNAAPPEFNPRLDIFDAKGTEFLTNVARTPKYRDSKAAYLIAVEPKVVATFEQEGEYCLKIRDVTNRGGNAAYRYRVMIRPQIPHIGDIVVETRTRLNEDGRLDPWRVNLRAGEARKLNVIVDHEEGFYHPANLVSIHIDGLPPGVIAVSGSSNPSLASRFTGPAVQKPERYYPSSQNLSIVLEAGEDALATKMPVLAKVRARSYVNGKPGRSIDIGELPVMVLPPAGQR